MPLLGKVPVAIATTSSVVAGGIYCAYKYNLSDEKPKSFSDYKEAFIDLTKDDNIWDDRLKTLESGQVLGASEKLKEAQKQKNKKLLKDSCEEFYSPKFLSKSIKDLDDFKKYCAKTNKDVLGNTWFSEFEKSKHEAKLIAIFKEKGDKFISPKLDAIFREHTEKENSSDLVAAINNWCNEVGKSIHLGKLLDFNTSEIYCKALPEAA